MTSIQGLSAATFTPTQSAGQVTEATPGEKPFTDFLRDSLQEVNSMQAEADKAVQQLITGGDVNPAEVLTAVQKADMSFRLMMQIRNKLVSAYQEINNVRI
jgi:flagellar hook-basal body complex protein FliE